MIFVLFAIVVTVAIAIILFTLLGGIIYYNTFCICRLVNHEVSVDTIKFDSCILPYSE